MGLVTQSGWYTSLIKQASNNLAISPFITSFLSWAKWRSRCLTGLFFRSKCSLCSINSPGTPGMSAGFHVKMALFSWRNLMSACSYLGSKLLPTWVTLEDSSMDNGIVLLSVSSGWMDVLEVLASGMTGSGWDSANSCLNSWSSMDASNLSAVSQLSRSQSKAAWRLLSWRWCQAALASSKLSRRSVELP
jgi:hypothetical protein